MPLAFFRHNLVNASIDYEKGIIRGVMVMELGKPCCFQDSNGKIQKVTISNKHVEALLAHAGNRAIPMHKTHEWFDSIGTDKADSVEMEARTGALKSFAKDDKGNLRGDVFLMDNGDRANILWGAEHNPEDNMLSAVFQFAPDDKECIPINFKAVDLVPVGAATTALFRTADNNQNNNENTNMPPIDKKDFLELLKDPEVISALSQPAITATLTASRKTETDAEALHIETVNGVTDADKKPEDDAMPNAILRAHSRVARATTRKIGETALLAEAAATKTLGKGGFITNTDGDGKKEEAETALAPYVAAAPNRATAILRFAKDKPDAYNKLRAAGKI